jgi:hypothetical protein
MADLNATMTQLECLICITGLVLVPLVLLAVANVLHKEIKRTE